MTENDYSAEFPMDRVAAPGKPIRRADTLPDLSLAPQERWEQERREWRLDHPVTDYDKSKPHE